jgi:general bacterial porin, GBP family
MKREMRDVIPEVTGKASSPARARALAARLSVGALLAIPAAAQADSILLGGNIDTGVAYTSNASGHALWSSVNGMILPSNWYLEGSDDLGQGYRGVFYLYAPFNIDSGVSNPIIDNGFFNATGIGLAADHIGSLTMGRAWDPSTDLMFPYTSAYWLGYFATHLGDADNLRATARADGAFKFMSVPWNGWSLGALYAPEASSNKREVDVSLAYTAQDFSLAGGYFDIDRADASAAENALVSAYALYGLTRFDISPNRTAIALRQHSYMTAASYQIGRCKFDGVLSYLNYSYANDTTLDLYNAEINAHLQIDAADSATLAFDQTRVTAGPPNYRPVWNQINAGVTHQLSRRTALYASVSWQEVGGSGVNNAQIFGAAPSSTRTQVAAVVGMSHAF